MSGPKKIPTTWADVVKKYGKQFPDIRQADDIRKTQNGIKDTMIMAMVISVLLEKKKLADDAWDDAVFKMPDFRKSLATPTEESEN